MTRERLLRLFTQAPNAFWRHDVDVSLSAAVQMARMAHLAGVQSTFYLMVASPFYNLLGPEGRAAVGTIRSLGHQLGVHSDCRYATDPEQQVARDLQIVDTAIPGVFDLQVSFHMPTADLLWRDFDGFDSAYGSQWEGRYVSDSRREWDAEKEARVSDDMQINLHPEHWF